MDSGDGQAGLNLSDDFLRGRDGVGWTRVGDVLDPTQAQRLVQDGAVVAWDPCGCGGACGLTWLDNAACERLARSAPQVRPSKRYAGAVTQWRNERGGTLLLVQGGIRWGEDLR